MNSTTFARHAARLLSTLILISGTASADLLVLTNGDRITGQIKRIWDAEITIEPGYSDEFHVDLSAVSYIESTRELEIELIDGRVIDARLGGADAKGQQVFHTSSGTFSAPLVQLAELDEPVEALEWDTNIAISANLNRGNTESTTSKLRGDTTIRTDDHRHIAELTYFREDLAGVSTKEQDLFRYSYNWFFTDDWFFSADLSFERDPIVELESRVIVSAGIGRDIWDTPRRTLNVRLGAGGQTEDIGMVSEDSTVITWGLRFRQDFFGDDFGLFHNQSITLNISGRTNTSYKTSTGISYEITDLLSANVSLDYDYETDPVNFAKNEDIILLFGFGAEF